MGKKKVKVVEKKMIGWRRCGWVGWGSGGGGGEDGWRFYVVVSCFCFLGFSGF